VWKDVDRFIHAKFHVDWCMDEDMCLENVNFMKFETVIGNCPTASLV